MSRSRQQLREPYRRWLDDAGFALLVGNSAGVYGYQQGAFGAINPSSFQGVEIIEFSANTTGNVCILRFAANAKVEPHEDLIVTVDGVEYTYAWSTTHYTITSVAITNYLVAADGTQVTIGIKPPAYNSYVVQGDGPGGTSTSGVLLRVRA